MDVQLCHTCWWRWNTDTALAHFRLFLCDWDGGYRLHWPLHYKFLQTDMRTRNKPYAYNYIRINNSSRVVHIAREDKVSRREVQGQQRRSTRDQGQQKRRTRSTEEVKVNRQGQQEIKVNRRGGQDQKKKSRSTDKVNKRSRSTEEEDKINRRGQGQQTRSTRDQGQQKRSRSTDKVKGQQTRTRSTRRTRGQQTRSTEQQLRTTRSTEKFL